MLCTASDTFRILACIGVFKAYSGLFRHIQHPVEPSHIHKLAIYWPLTYLEPEAYLKPCKKLTRHIRNPAIGHYSDIFRTLWNADIRKKTDILGILEYSEPFHNCIPTHIQNPLILTKIYEYSERWHILSLTHI